MARTRLNISGMTCNHCVSTVQHALDNVQGVRSARVDLDSGTAVVDYDDARADPREIATAVADAGYQASSAD